MKKKLKPYVGVTGFMSRYEIGTVLGSINESKAEDRLVMVGVLASHKTMEGERNKWPARYPKKEDIANLFSSDPRALNLIHYNTKHHETLPSQMAEITRIGGDFLHGFQLNLFWPNGMALQQYRRMYPEKVIVLQVGRNAYLDVNNSPERLAFRLKDEYDGLVDYVLLDPSGGYGLPFDTEVARRQLEALLNKNLNMLFGVAGGLSSSTFHLVEPLIKDFPNLCIDAEGQLRTPKPEDKLDIKKACSYIEKSFGIFNA